MKDGVVLVSTGKIFHQTTRAVYAEDEWQLPEPLALTYGSRYEQQQIFCGHASPRACLVCNTSADLIIKGGVTTGYKVTSCFCKYHGAAIDVSTAEQK